ncbi:MAG TPA: peptidylprolyl isomerase, partial [Methylophilaceae bacterium]|nr:peptidylprolyl isomerase [Methylophilaceae bacterium]
MKISQHKSLSLAAALLVGAMTFPAAAAESVATVNGKPVKQSLYDYIVKDANARGQTIDETTRKTIVDKLIASELVFQEAQRL